MREEKKRRQGREGKGAPLQAEVRINECWALFRPLVGAHPQRINQKIQRTELNAGNTAKKITVTACNRVTEVSRMGLTNISG